jgi:hypothetical protein
MNHPVWEPFMFGGELGIGIIASRDQRPGVHCRLPIADCRLKRWHGSPYQCPSARHGGAIDNRQSAIENRQFHSPCLLFSGRIPGKIRLERGAS